MNFDKIKSLTTTPDMVELIYNFMHSFKTLNECKNYCKSNHIVFESFKSNNTSVNKTLLKNALDPLTGEHKLLDDFINVLEVYKNTRNVTILVDTLNKNFKSVMRIDFEGNLEADGLYINYNNTVKNGLYYEDYERLFLNKLSTVISLWTELFGLVEADSSYHVFKDTSNNDKYIKIRYDEEEFNDPEYYLPPTVIEITQAFRVTKLIETFE